MFLICHKHSSQVSRCTQQGTHNVKSQNTLLQFSNLHFFAPWAIRVMTLHEAWQLVGTSHLAHTGNKFFPIFWEARKQQLTHPICFTTFKSLLLVGTYTRLQYQGTADRRIKAIGRAVPNLWAVIALAYELKRQETAHISFSGRWFHKFLQKYSLQQASHSL